MRRFSSQKRIVTLFLMLSLLGFGQVFAQDLFLLGEDVRVGERLVITVNALTRKAFTGGLTTQAKTDLVELAMTLVNTGNSPITIDPAVQFSFELNDTYHPENEKSGTSPLFRQFTVNPGTNSRGNVYFRARTSDIRTQPRFLFSDDTHRIIIVCNDELARAMEKYRAGSIDSELAERLGRFLLDAERMKDADAFLRAMMQKFPTNPVLMMQYAGVLKGVGRDDEAVALLARISPEGLGREDALDFAKQAYELGQYSVCRRIMEPLAEKGGLNDKELLFLGRCWYFDQDFERAENLLSDLHARGMKDKNISFTLGNINEKRKNWRTAIDWWNKTMALDPQHYEALFNIGVGYYRLDEKDRAIQCWRRVLDLNPDSETRQAVLEALKQVQ